MKGGEGEAAFAACSGRLDNKIMRSVLAPGASIGLHTHETQLAKSCIFCPAPVRCCMTGYRSRWLPATCHYCPKGHSHSLVNDGTEDLVTFAVVPEHEKR